MLVKILLIVAVLIAAVLGYAATRPDAFRVQRSVAIQAPPEKILAIVNDYRRWADWSPYEKLDPQMKRNFSGPAHGKGAGYAWDGNGKVGAGHMEITETTPSKTVIALEFERPFKASNVAEFSTGPKGGATELTWAMYGPSPYLSKVIGLFCNVDKMVGKDFETGLANLKALAEK